MKAMTFAEQQAANKKDKIHGIVTTVLSVALIAILFVGIANQLGR